MNASRHAALIWLLPAALLAQKVLQPSHNDGAAEAGDLTHVTHTLRLEEEKVWVHVFQRPGESITFVNLHDNENTAAEAAMNYLLRHGGRLVELRHGRGREVVIRRRGQLDRFDPNRMFTLAGLRRTLDYYHSLSDDNLAVAGAFVGEITELIGPLTGIPIVAVHNNFDGSLAIHDFQPGQLYGAAAREVVMNAREDPDNFFFTNSPELFAGLSSRGFNAALMRPEPPDIGSLGYLVNRSGGIYVLVEVEHGRLKQQLRMLEALGALLPKKAPSASR